jgi:RNA polymerase sigma-70 factor (ECF subfamily)
MSDTNTGSAGLDFERIVQEHYHVLYQFAMGLTRNETEASDLTQETFYLWGTKGHMLRDPSKVRSWLFTTLHRDFLKSRRRQNRFPEQELSAAESELPSVSPAMVDQMDSQTVMDTLGRVDDSYRAALTLFYLEDFSYQQIAETLEIPIGTVMSRIARGRAQLQRMLLEAKPAQESQRG